MGPPIVQVALAYGAGLWVGLVFLVPQVVLWCGIPAGMALAARGGWRGALCAAAILGSASGTWAVVRDASTCGAVWPRGREVALVRLQDAPGSRPIAEATVLYTREGCSGGLRLRLNGTDLSGGVRILVVGTYRGSGVLRADHVRELAGGRSWRYALREAVAARVRSLYGTRAGLVEAIVLGRKDGIEPRLKAGFTAAGLAHLLAISGLHVGVLAGWILLVARLLGVRRRAWLLGCLVVWCYVGLLGFPAPATRAAAFISIIGLSRARQRHPPPNAVLAVALLLILTIDPGAATSVGAWLSAAAVWGTRTGSALLPRFRLFGASLGATIATAPITALVFGSVAPVGAIANLVAVPLAGIVVPGLFLSLLLGGPLAGGTGLVLAGLEAVARVCAEIPGGHLTGTPGPAFALPWVLVLGLALWLRSRRPSPRRVLWRFLVGAALGSWAWVAVAAFAGRERSPGLVIHFLAVGQGDAAALRTPHGAWVLVDGGPRLSETDAGSRVVVPFLRRRGVTELDAVFVSHGDADHLGGIPAVIRALAPALVLDPGQPLGTGLYLEYLATVDGAGSEWRPARAGDVMMLDSVRFEVIHPTTRWLERHLIPNENSLVLRVTYGCFTALLTGDIGLPAESLLLGRVGEADLLKVGHHGSASSTGSAWLDAVQPRAAVVSVGRNNYGHPSDVVLQRLRSRGVELFRTDRGGTVTVRTDGDYFHVSRGDPQSLTEALRCLIQPLLRSSASSWSRSGCTRRPVVTLPSCSTILH